MKYVQYRDVLLKDEQSYDVFFYVSHDDKSSNRGGSLQIILFACPPQLQYSMHLQAQLDSVKINSYVRAGFSFKKERIKR